MTVQVGRGGSARSGWSQNHATSERTSSDCTIAGAGGGIEPAELQQAEPLPGAVGA